mmetsp:Transcript_54466/g.174651  ORF Transcript_54466/g.174651 Transcript_54466/m.174651 type:complete len:318 (-) Transcript_54466:42-995(-)
MSSDGRVGHLSEVVAAPVRQQLHLDIRHLVPRRAAAALPVRLDQHRPDARFMLVRDEVAVVRHVRRLVGEHRRVTHHARPVVQQQLRRACVPREEVAGSDLVAARLHVVQSDAKLPEHVSLRVLEFHVAGALESDNVNIAAMQQVQHVPPARRVLLQLNAGVGVEHRVTFWNVPQDVLHESGPPQPLLTDARLPHHGAPPSVHGLLGQRREAVRLNEDARLPRLLAELVQRLLEALRGEGGEVQPRAVELGGGATGRLPGSTHVEVEVLAVGRVHLPTAEVARDARRQQRSEGHPPAARRQAGACSRASGGRTAMKC